MASGRNDRAAGVWGGSEAHQAFIGFSISPRLVSFIRLVRFSTTLFRLNRAETLLLDENLLYIFKAGENLMSLLFIIIFIAPHTTAPRRSALFSR